MYHVSTAKATHTHSHAPKHTHTPANGLHKDQPPHTSSTMRFHKNHKHTCKSVIHACGDDCILLQICMRYSCIVHAIVEFGVLRRRILGSSETVTQSITGNHCPTEGLGGWVGLP